MLLCSSEHQYQTPTQKIDVEYDSGSFLVFADTSFWPPFKPEAEYRS